MKRLSLWMISCLLFLLTACEQAIPNEPIISDPPNPSPVVAPSSAANDKAPLPWNSVSQPETVPYHEYFEQLIDYGYDWFTWGKDAELNVISGGNISPYELTYESPFLYLTRQRTGERLWTVTESEGLQVVLYDSSWIYAISNETELFRMDYWGENKQTLFIDESGLISQNKFYLGDEKVLYFLAGLPDGGAAFYRLYVPEARTDLLYQYEELESYYFPAFDGGPAKYQIGSPYPVSNYEFVWGTSNRAFYELLEQLKEDPETYNEYFKDSGTAIGRIAADYKVYPYTEHYYNGLTGEHYEQAVTGYSTEARTRWWNWMCAHDMGNSAQMLRDAGLSENETALTIQSLSQYFAFQAQMFSGKRANIYCVDSETERDAVEWAEYVHEDWTKQERFIVDCEVEYEITQAVWQNDKKSFSLSASASYLIGYRKDEKRLPATQTEAIERHYTIVGSFDEWNVYLNVEPDE